MTTLDPFDDVPAILAALEPAGGWEGTTPAERAAGERLLSRVKAERPGGCLLSTYARMGTGGDYRGIAVGGRKVQAHRLALSLAHGVSLSDLAATGLVVMHRCDVPRCIAPGHLGLGSVADNNADMSKKGRLINPLARARAARTHCLRGHSLQGANLRLSGGTRSCRLCSRASTRVSHIRRRNGGSLSWVDALAYQVSRATPDVLRDAFGDDYLDRIASANAVRWREALDLLAE